MYNEKNFRIQVIDHPDPTIVKKILEIDRETWGIGGINEWVISPFILHGLVIFCYIDDIPAGLSILFKDYKEIDKIFMFDFIILHNFQKKGIGKRFFKEILLILQQNKIRTLSLTVSPKNQPAIRIYRDFGNMVLTGTYTDLYGPGEDRVCYEGKVDQMLS